MEPREFCISWEAIVTSSSWHNAINTPFWFVLTTLSVIKTVLTWPSHATAAARSAPATSRTRVWGQFSIPISHVTWAKGIGQLQSRDIWGPAAGQSFTSENAVKERDPAQTNVPVSLSKGEIESMDI